MPKYKVLLDSGVSHTVEADIVTTDPCWVRFDSRSAANKPSELSAIFPAKSIVEITKE